jgi:lysophospholipase L1-like esterase
MEMSNRLRNHACEVTIAAREKAMRLTPILATILLSACAAPMQAGPSLRWVESWGTALPLQPPSPSPFGNARPPSPPQGQPAAPNPRIPFPASFSDQTVRMILRTTLAGEQVRLEFANRHGAAPVRLGAVRIARAALDGTIDPSSDQLVTFAGARETTLQPGERIVSDAVSLPVSALAHVAVSIHLPDQTPADTVDEIGLMPAFIAPGNQTAASALADPQQAGSFFWLRGLSVAATEDEGGAIIAFGDSITEGYATALGSSQSWPDRLAERLQQEPDLRGWSVINTGISGNRVLRPGAGEAALARFTDDVLSRPGARWVIVLESINDINMTIIPGMAASQHASASQIIAGLDQLITRAHLHGLKIAGGTVMPTRGLPIYTDEGEAMRQEINQWIRTSGRFDAVIDFDAATGDPADPLRLLPAFDPGDHIHPNDAGNRAMAEAIDLEIFRRD